MLALYPWFVFFLTLATPMIWGVNLPNRDGGNKKTAREQTLPDGAMTANGPSVEALSNPKAERKRRERILP